MKRRAPGDPAPVEVPVGPPGRPESGLRTRASLAVGPAGVWFQLPGEPVVSLERWRSLQRVLACLAEERQDRPGGPLSVEALVTAGWPGERMLARAGATRVYTAIASLRRLGLRDVLLSTDQGYLLAPGLPLELAIKADTTGS
jgi:hypothetical protein